MRKIKKIQIIEDQKGFRRVFRDALEEHGYEVLEASDGHEGWKQMRIEQPDLVILDLILPKIPGFRILRKMKDDPKTESIPVIVFSALADEQQMRKAKLMGAIDYWVKGLSAPLELVEKIREVMGDVKKKKPVETAEKEAPAAPGLEDPFRLTVGLRKAGATDLQQHVGVTDLFGCPDCDSPSTVLELYPDPSRDEGNWYMAHFVCPKCQRSF